MGLVTGRGDWGARKGPGPPIGVPTPEVYIHHDVFPVPGGANATVAEEKAHMRRLEDLRGFSIGVPYSFSIFPSGRIYEGQGWGREGAHTCNGPPITRCWNKTAHGLCFNGNYETTRLPDAARSAMRELIELGIDKEQLSKNVLVHPHRKVKATACPGTHVLPHLDYFENGGDELTPEQEKKLEQAFNFAEKFKTNVPVAKFGAAGLWLAANIKSLIGHEHPHEHEGADPTEPHTHPHTHPEAG